ncbi:bifunctional adenosylcobinamide kinase/adenosylcobinamide-phosphate guanylyltransferase [Paenibacillus sp. OAS669]|uniref:bifunctional adenosylcobinamide kinase/adenosylcobinamide-phosphate guanylyltransferase n=1 Tax=Paenibacillus sp. OAS669 TaxID=2663821 RepID=UPI001789BA47|nr:bifunctional adenosylcobinamide kinase/adenosylcobinamide-phosphate guanylyltransferase [Paenibacillus sp. OAS669]MBE1441558.1 adenosylcobinamide kinase/adenosylcobinamide-phosphate guanylyltransferase [Paenibacillus sp. OAS669]
MLVLVTGGARSGKSSFAEAYASRLEQRGIYIATAQAYDEEMKARIGLHRKQRDEAGFPWTTLEEPFELDRLLNGWCDQMADHSGSQPNVHPQPIAAEGAVVLVDCLTLWLSNWLLRYEQDANAEQLLRQKVDELTAAGRRFADQGRHLVLVTNEVGYGLVPEYKLGRQFRDLSGIMNQRLAREAEQVFLVTAGIPMEIKSRQFQW